MKNKITIGSRESKLAVLQSEMVRDYIKNHDPELEVEILTMKTTGDKILDRTLDKVGGKGLFVKELDHALLDGRTELSVHSLKDMPMEVPAELPLLAFSKREDPPPDRSKRTVSRSSNPVTIRRIACVPRSAFSSGTG